MKLEINLTDREEVAAAVPLLQLILDNTKGRAPVCIPLVQAAPATVGASSLPIAQGVSQAFSLPPAPASLPPAMNIPASVAPMPPAPPVSPVNDVEFDSRGLPWDERIHASTKAKIANGEWRGKRGVDETLCASVEAELRALLAVGQVPAIPNAPQWPGPSAADASSVFGGEAIPMLFRSEEPSPHPAAIEPTTFEQLMTRVSPHVIAGTLPATALQTAVTQLGLASVVALQTSPQFVPNAWAVLKQAYPGVA